VDRVADGDDATKCTGEDLREGRCMEEDLRGRRRTPHDLRHPIARSGGLIKSTKKGS
jgi:hypothetical protein